MKGLSRSGAAIVLALLSIGPAAAQQRPTELLIGPRVDVVKPERLELGQHYQLELYGKNFIVGMMLSFGDDIQVIGFPYISSPTKAVVDVLVPLVAPPGVRPATATSREGGNTGPGGVFIGPVLNDPSSDPTPTPRPRKPKKQRKK